MAVSLKRKISCYTFLECISANEEEFPNDSFQCTLAFWLSICQRNWIHGNL